MKIKSMRAQLSNEKRIYGGYDDSRGVRYLVLAECIKIADYKTGLNYIRWFNKNFPDDIGYPIFLFEQTIVLFKAGKLIEAESTMLRTYFGNTYLFDQFLIGNQEDDMDRMQWNDWEGVQILDDFPYTALDPELTDFTEWLQKSLRKPLIANKMSDFIEILRRLIDEDDAETRDFLKGWMREMKKSHLNVKP
jgi:hypothetical protein